jgi:hypothetical protein
MSTSYSAFAIVGIRLDRKALEKVFAPKPEFKEKDGCKCNKKHTAFCPKCGAKNKIRTQTNEDLISEFDLWTFLDDMFGEEQALIKFCNGTDGEPYYFGLVLEQTADGWRDTGADFTTLTAKNLEDIKAELKSFFEPKGLWDEKWFGLHVVCQIS